VTATTLEQRLRFVTLTVALDYLRDSNRLYNAGRATFDDPETGWLYEPEEVACARFTAVSKALTKHKLAQRATRDADVWSTVCKKLVDHYQGHVSELLNEAHNSAPQLLTLIREKSLPSLSGAKVGSLWTRMLSDSCCKLSGLSEIPIPVDRHVLNSSLAFGAITLNNGYLREDLELADATPPVQSVWFSAAALGGFRAIDLDVSLWYLGKLGCSKGEPCPKRHECVVKDFCTYWSV
jgi:hypothetical protein